jgi:hypothetical protein
VLEEAPAPDHAQAAPGGVARDADAIQATADNRQIVVRHAQRLPERAVTESDSIAFSSDVDTGLREETRQNKIRRRF